MDNFLLCGMESLNFHGYVQKKDVKWISPGRVVGENNEVLVCPVSD